VKKCKK